MIAEIVMTVMIVMIAANVMTVVSITIPALTHHVMNAITITVMMREIVIIAINHSHTIAAEIRVMDVMFVMEDVIMTKKEITTEMVMGDEVLWYVGNEWSEVIVDVF